MGAISKRAMIKPMIPALVVVFLLLSWRSAPAQSSHTAPGKEPHTDADRPKIGLALSGGGAKGIAHVGVLKVLEELEVPIDYIAGTSMGALIGGLYASGMTPDEMSEMILTVDWDDLMSDKPARKDLSFRRKTDDQRYLLDLQLGIKWLGLKFPSGLMAGQKLTYLLRMLTLDSSGVRDFDDLPTPFRAVATDISTGNAVVMGEGDLVWALRASMSIPTVFSSVVTDDGQMLVDGGIVNNIPVDVVREMGADIVIAVDLGMPLSEREVKNLVQVYRQTMRMLTRRNMEPQLEDADLILSPAVSRFGTLQFDEAEAILQLGFDEAHAREDQLQVYSDPVTFKRIQVKRERHSAPLPEIGFIRWQGNDRVDDRIIEEKLRLQPGDALDLDILREDLLEIYGLGDFEQVGFSIAEEDDELGLIIHMVEKPWGPSYLHFGLFFDVDLDGNNEFKILTNITATRINALGAEWHNDLVIGQERGVFSEFYQPLDFEGRWFLAPNVEFSQFRRGFYDKGKRTAELDIRKSGLALDAGYQFSKWAEARLGYWYGRATAKVDSGFLPGDLDGYDLSGITYGGILAQVNGDRLDNAHVPRNGGEGFFRAFFSFEGLGAEVDYTKIEARGNRFQSFGRHTVMGSLHGGWSPGDDLPIHDQFTLGGLGSLSGFERDELRGQHFGLLRIGYYYNLFGQVHTGGLVEAGQMWKTEDDISFSDPIFTGTAFIVMDSAFGPLTFAAAWAEQGRNKFYIQLGRSF